MIIRLSYILLIFGISQSSIAQLPISDSTPSIAINTYYSALGEQSPIYNGSEYIPPDVVLQEGHVFFESNVFTNGTIGFDGMLFKDVPILYDLLKDEIIIQHYSQAFKICLPAEKIEYFTLPGHNFVRLAPDSLNQIKPGFYEKLYDGKTKLFVKHEKKIREEHTAFEIRNVITQSNTWYIKKDGIYYTVNKMSALLDILKDKRKEIQQYLGKNNIEYKNDPEKAMISALGYYDQTTN